VCVYQYKQTDKSSVAVNKVR